MVSLSFLKRLAYWAYSCFVLDHSNIRKASSLVLEIQPEKIWLLLVSFGPPVGIKENRERMGGFDSFID